PRVDRPFGDRNPVTPPLLRRHWRSDFRVPTPKKSKGYDSQTESLRHSVTHQRTLYPRRASVVREQMRAEPIIVWMRRQTGRARQLRSLLPQTLKFLTFLV